jgi:hypothetical protein
MHLLRGGAEQWDEVCILILKTGQGHVSRHCAKQEGCLQKKPLAQVLVQ